MGDPLPTSLPYHRGSTECHQHRDIDRPQDSFVLPLGFLDLVSSLPSASAMAIGPVCRLLPAGGPSTCTPGPGELAWPFVLKQTTASNSSSKPGINARCGGRNFLRFHALSPWIPDASSRLARSRQEKQRVIPALKAFHLYRTVQRKPELGHLPEGSLTPHGAGLPEPIYTGLWMNYRSGKLPRSREAHLHSSICSPSFCR